MAVLVLEIFPISNEGLYIASGSDDLNNNVQTQSCTLWEFVAFTTDETEVPAMYVELPPSKILDCVGRWVL